MKLNKSVKFVSLLFLSALGIGIVVAAAVKLASSFEGDGVVTKCQSGSHESHVMVIKDENISPAYIETARCDTLKVVNMDRRGRLMAFGKHEQHIPYDGISERFLIKNESLTVTLVKTGTYLLHDHNDEDVKASFKVTN